MSKATNKTEGVGYARHVMKTKFAECLAQMVFDKAGLPAVSPQPALMPECDGPGRRPPTGSQGDEQASSATAARTKASALRVG